MFFFDRKQTRNKTIRLFLMLSFEKLIYHQRATLDIWYTRSLVGRYQSRAKQSKANARRWRSRCIPLYHTSVVCMYDVNPCIHDSMITHTGTHQLSAKPKTIALPVLPSSSSVCLAAIFLYLPHRHRLCSMRVCMCVCVVRLCLRAVAFLLILTLFVYGFFAAY